MNYLFSWLIIALLFLILEMSTPGLFYFLSFAIGAALTALISIYFDSFTVQCSFFLLATILALAILKYAIRTWKRNTKTPTTNIYALQGKKGLVLSAIAPNLPGQVKILGEIWSARPHNQTTIPAGATVEIISHSGAFLIVKEVS